MDPRATIYTLPIPGITISPFDDNLCILSQQGRCELALDYQLRGAITPLIPRKHKYIALLPESASIAELLSTLHILVAKLHLHTCTQLLFPFLSYTVLAMADIDVEHVLSQLTLQEKASLTAGSLFWFLVLIFMY